jgi:hypothetical protein
MTDDDIGAPRTAHQNPPRCRFLAGSRRMVRMADPQTIAHMTSTSTSASRGNHVGNPAGASAVVTHDVYAIPTAAAVPGPVDSSRTAAS